ncbi:RDD family protein [Pleomorphovibrio marinus]|uniref:RDD family protein n=1 Tax=Pleomorphovibrio marinus TaxID=2164132 RepID=UPI000E0A8B4E|nr:RDD family protein [Pleomorphovibrio marinus]
MEKARVIFLLKRALAFSIDFLLIGLWIGFLLLIGLSLTGARVGWESLFERPALAHLISFVSVTLPVILYFSLFESGKRKGSLGKWLLHLAVVKFPDSDRKITFQAALLRNFLKFTPWELSHVLIHYGNLETPNNAGSMFTLIGLSLLSLAPFFFLSEILFQKNQRTLYDRLAGVCVVEKGTKCY